MLRLIGLLLLIPLLDALLLVVLGATFSWPLVVLAVVLTALVGLVLVRAEGRHTVRKIQQKLVQGEAPTDELIDGGLLIAAGAFLLTPGLVTDAIGFLLVIPLTRYPIRVALKKWVVVPYADKKTGGFATGNVYVGGFPDEDPRDATGGPRSSGGPDSSGGFDDATDVEFDDVDDER
ncbi:MAG: FxsA family protein [Halovenus sp.]